MFIYMVIAGDDVINDDGHRYQILIANQPVSVQQAACLEVQDDSPEMASSYLWAKEYYFTGCCRGVQFWHL